MICNSQRRRLVRVSRAHHAAQARRRLALCRADAAPILEPSPFALAVAAAPLLVALGLLCCWYTMRGRG